MNLNQAIRHSYLIQGLSHGEIVSIVAIASQKTYRDEEVIIRQGEESTDLMLILEGAARIVTTGGEKLADIRPPCNSPGCSRFTP